jgi:two-component system, response regulator PdtaR
VLFSPENNSVAAAGIGDGQGILRRFGKPLNVLIVEDEPLTALDFSLMVEDAGGRAVGTASSAMSAEAMAKSASPDIILMDVRLMGERDGIDAARAIRAFSAVPIVFVTGNADRTTAERIRDFEGGEPVPKPVTQETLVNAVVEAIAGARVG